METKVVKIEEEHLLREDIQKMLMEAGQVIKDGGLVAFPTETVYGLGGDGLNPSSSKKIYAAKGRPSDNPLIIHISKWESLKELVADIPESAKLLAQAFWPGPLTMVFRKSDKVPKETTGGLDTVAVRMPNDKVALAFIEAAGGYIAAPSANTSGRPSPTLAKYVYQDLQGKIEMILDGGQVCIGLESTIVDLTEETPMILRPGYITQSMLEEVIGKVACDKTMMNLDATQAPKAPGMKYRHYAPKGVLTIVAGEEGNVVKHINEQIRLAEESGKSVGVIATDATMHLYHAKTVKSAGDRAHEETVAKELYRILREFDDEKIDVIFSESFGEDGIGQAIMNRLLKAAGHRVENV